MIFKVGDSLTIFAKLIPVSLFGTGLNNGDGGFCAKAENEIKSNTCRYSSPLFIMADRQLNTAIRLNGSDSCT